MADSLNIQPQIAPKKDNTKRNVAIATGVGAVGGGAIGYITKNVMKNGELTDEFTKKLIDNALKETYKGDKTTIKLTKDVLKLAENPTAETVKQLIKKHAKYFKLEGEKLAETLKEIDESVVEYFNKNIMPIKEKFEKTVEILTNSIKNNYDAKTKKFTISNPEGAAFVNNAKRSIKGKAGLIWGAASAITLGFGTWVVSKVVDKKED